MNRDARIYVAGHRGLVGSALIRKLQAEGFRTIITRSHDELDLTQASSVHDFFAQEQPEYVFLAAARVGGILANSTYPADFIYQNLSIQTNVIEAAYHSRVSRMIFLGSSCIYPRECPQPMCEDSLLTGPLEPTNEAYAIAKIAGIKMCHAYNQQYGTQYLAVMPTNLYGPNDNYDLETSHVIPALIRKFHEGKERKEEFVQVWGTGQPRREFLHVDDLADACIFLMRLSRESFDTLIDVSRMPLINIGYGSDLTIAELAQMIAKAVGYDGRIEYDTNRPDGVPQKLLDVTRMNQLGWKPKLPLSEGIVATCRNFIQHDNNP